MEPYIGRRRRETDEVTLGACRRLAAMLDLAPAELTPGTTLPPGWHAILFAPSARQEALGADGHPRGDDFMPPSPLPRRMLAGRRVTFHAPLRIGDSVERRSEILGVEERTGRSGALVFVTLEHRISGPAGPAVTEEQQVVYRAAAASQAAPHAAAEAPSAGTAPAAGGATAGGSTTGGSTTGGSTKGESAAAWQRRLTVDNTLLFRYSALTYNAHRIHYDLEYARRVEGYPGLVVNGGLTTLLLLELARAHGATPLAGFTARAIRPLYAGDTLTLCGTPGPDPAGDKTEEAEGAVRLWALDGAGTVAFRIEARLAR